MKKISLVLASILMTLSVAYAATSGDDGQVIDTLGGITLSLEEQSDVVSDSPTSVVDLWESANTSYREGDYDAAIAAYTAMIDAEEISWEVYYNLGATYFKDGQIGRAILNTERAARLEPANRDIEDNLEVLRAHTQDRIESLPQFFLVDRATTIRDNLSPNSWTVILLVFLAFTVIFFVAWFRLKRGGLLALTIIMGVFTLSGWGFAHSSYAAIEGGDSAIVLNSAAVVRSSPDAAGKELFILHQGTKVEIEDSYGIYSEVVVASGNKGWIATKDIEKI